MSRCILDTREKSAYFPFGETAVTDLLEGQLAFLHHVRSYEEAHPGTRFMQRNLCWKFEFLNCCIGSLPKEQLDEISSEINAVVQLGGSPNSWLFVAARLCRRLFGTPRSSSWATIWKLQWSSWRSTRPSSLSVGSHESFSLS